MDEEPDPQRVRLLVAYDGTDFAGFAANEGVRTVAGELGAALERYLGAPVTLSVAGRTDKGVHASGQVCSFDLPTHIARERGDLTRLVRAVNSLCARDLAVLEAAAAAPDFDARFSARWRRYRYTVWNRPARHPLWDRHAWHVEAPLDLAAMGQAAVPLVGEHDFASFCRRPPDRRDGTPSSTVRRVLDADWADLGDGRLVFEIRATAFCHQMVRSVTGLLVDVGRGRRRAAEVRAVLAARDRGRSANVAPPHGLCLVEVGY